jgi:hypothetical protein
MAIDKLETILNLELSKNPQLNVEGDWESIVKKAPIIKDANNLIYDGWGIRYDVGLDQDRGGVKVSSQKLEEYEKSKLSK